MKSSRTIITTAFAALTVTTTTALAGGTLTVPGPLNLTIQQAINIVNGDPASWDEIIVEPGTYFENLDLNGAEVYLHSSGGAASTIIDGGDVSNVILCLDGETSSTIIEGFTIQNGLGVVGGRGGGLYCNNASPVVRDCVFKDNEAPLGGGMYANGGSPQVVNCEFRTNHVTTSGGGAMYINQVSNLVLDGLLFDGNTSDETGGAVELHGGSTTLVGCTFINNSCTTNGGAVWATNGADYDRCVFDNNFAGNGAAQGRGGAIYMADNGGDVTQCVFLNNECTKFGGAIYIIGAAHVLHCSFWNHTAEGQAILAVTGSAGGSTMHNSVAWGITGSDAVGGTPTNLTATYNNIEGGLVGTGNIGGDSMDNPLFVDPANGDLRLMEGSPSVDAGDATILDSDFTEDFDGLMRVSNFKTVDQTGKAIVGYYVDQGAFELQGAGVPNDCPSDVTPPGGNNVINIDDLLKVISDFGSCPE